ncbi:hypothetical protein NXH56_04850 [Bifidobacterium thermophilum]|nr:hypothetical protein [Bifidobacterium thermophilum]
MLSEPALVAIVVAVMGSTWLGKWVAGLVRRRATKDEVENKCVQQTGHEREAMNLRRVRTSRRNTPASWTTR